MTRANAAEAAWSELGRKKGWVVRIEVGAEVIKRPPEQHGLEHDAAEADVRAMAVRIAQDDGYELDPATVRIVR